MKYYGYLIGAIIFEIIGASMLKLSEGFTYLVPSLILILSYICSFGLLILALKSVALSIGYSIWAGVGTAGTALVGYLFFKESLSFINFIGLVIIILGVILMNLSSKPTETTA